MHAANRMRLREALAGLRDIPNGIEDRKRTRALEDSAKIGAFEVLHDDERGAIVSPPDIEDARDMPAAKPNSGASFAEEPLDPLRVAKRGGEHELDGPELLELDMPSGEDDAHGPLAEGALDAIFAGEEVTGAEGRGGRGHGQEARVTCRLSSSRDPGNCC